MDSKPRWESKRRDGLNSLHGLKNIKRSAKLSQVNRNNDQVEGNKNSPDNILNSVSNLVEQHFFSPSKRRTMRDDEDNGFKYSKSSISLLRGLFISSTMEGGFSEIIGLLKRGEVYLIYSETLHSLYHLLIWLLKMRGEGRGS